MPSADVAVVGAGLAGLTPRSGWPRPARASWSSPRATARSTGPAARSTSRSRRARRVPPTRCARLERTKRHPYAVLGADVAPALEWFGALVADGGLPYVGSLETPIRRAPDGDRRHPPRVHRSRSRRRPPLDPWAPDERLVVAGQAGFKDFWPRAVAASLSRPEVWVGLGGPARVDGVAPDWPGLAERRNLNALRIAEAFDDPSWRAAALDLTAAGGGRDRARPACASRCRPSSACAAIRRSWREARRAARGAGHRGAARAARDPGHPPARRAPDARCGRAVGGSCSASGWPGSRRRGRMVTAVATAAATRELVTRVGALVLATGGMAGGGLVGEPEGGIRETILGLPVDGPPIDRWLGGDPLDPGALPIAAAGLRTDDALRPIDPARAQDGPLFDNVRVVGGLLAGQRVMVERCGDGVALASAWRAAASLSGGASKPKRSAAQGGGGAMTIAAVVDEALQRHASGCRPTSASSATSATRSARSRGSTDRFPGPKYVGPQAQRFRLAAPVPIKASTASRCTSPDRTVDWCSGCGWCTTACPAGVKIAEMNNRARAVDAGRPAPAVPRLAARPDRPRSGGSASPFTPLANWTLRNRLFRAAASRSSLGIHRKAPLPVFAGRSFRSRFARRGGYLGRADGAALPPPDRAVVYFHGCAANYYEPHVADAAIDVLRPERLRDDRAAAGVLRPADDQQRPVRRAPGTRPRRNLDVLAEYARRGYRIVGTSTSCTHTLKAEYGEMLDVRRRRRPRGRRRRPGTSASSCSTSTSRAGSTRASAASTRTLPYHAPCQLRSHGIGLPAMDLFALVPGLRAVDMDHDCCGIAGHVRAQEGEVRHRDGASATPLFRRIEASGAAETALRLRDVPLADRVGDEPTVAAPGRDPRRGLRGRRRDAATRRHPHTRAHARPRGRCRRGRLVPRLGACRRRWRDDAGPARLRRNARRAHAAAAGPARRHGSARGRGRGALGRRRTRSGPRDRRGPPVRPPGCAAIRSRSCRTSRCSPPRTGSARRRRPRPRARPGHCWRRR